MTTATELAVSDELVRAVAASADLILGSLGFTRENFRAYPHYPDEDFRTARLAEVQAAMQAVRACRDAARKWETIGGVTA